MFNQGPQYHLGREKEIKNVSTSSVKPQMELLREMNETKHGARGKLHAPIINTDHWSALAWIEVGKGEGMNKLRRGGKMLLGRIVD